MKCLDCEHLIVDGVVRCGGRRESPCVCVENARWIAEMKKPSKGEDSK